jgi:hypothetical protein
MDLKDVFDEILKRMQRARDKEIRPEIIRDPGEYSINLSDDKSPYRIMLKEYPRGVTINTLLSDRPQHQILMPGASLNDALRVIQAAIIIAYGKSLH